MPPKRLLALMLVALALLGARANEEHAGHAHAADEHDDHAGHDHGITEAEYGAARGSAERRGCPASKLLGIAPARRPAGPATRALDARSVRLLPSLTLPRRGRARQGGGPLRP